MIKNDISQIYDIRFIDEYDRFVNASLQRDYLERSIVAMSFLITCCGLVSQVKEDNEENRLIIMCSLVMMTGMYAMHRINKIVQHTVFTRFKI
jgi:hypothetical protein